LTGGLGSGMGGLGLSGGLQGNVNANKKAAQSPVRLDFGACGIRDSQA
jgi:hypothetical protein